MSRFNLTALILKPGVRAGIFFLLAFLFFYLQTEQKLYWDIFSTRDLQRALAWTKGQFHWPGPEMTAGGNLPGPFFYFLLIPPLLFPGGAYGNSILWHAVWLALTYTLVFYFVEKISKHKESVFILLILFITSTGYSLFEPFKFGRNAGFAVLFHILALTGLYNYKQTGKNAYLYFVGLITALGVQAHLLVSVHIITAILVFCLKKQKQPKTLLLFLFLSLLPFLIYFLLLDHFKIFSASDIKWQYLDHLKERFLDKTSQRNLKNNFAAYLLSGFFILILMYYRRWKLGGRLASKQMKDLLIVCAAPLFVFFLGSRYFWYLYAVPGVFLMLISKQFDDLVSFRSGKTRATHTTQKSVKYDDSASFSFPIGGKFVCLTVCAAAFCIFSPYKYVTHLKLVFTQDLNYPAIFSLAVLILLLTLGFLNPKKQSPYREYGKTVAIFCILFCLSLIHVTKPAPRRVKKSFSSRGVYSSYQEISPLMERIFLETGLPAKSAMKHLYSTKIFLEISLLAYYSMAMEKIEKIKNPIKPSERPDGYMIIPHIQKFSGYSSKDWSRYLSNSPLLSRFLQKEITEKKILIENSRLYDRYWLISYRTTEESVFPEGFHNTGQHYYWEEPEWLEKCKVTKSFKNKGAFYYCMVLPGYKQKAGVKIALAENAPGFLDMFFYGPLIGLSKDDTNLDGYGLWSNIELKGLCNDRRFRYALPNIGLDYADQKRPQIVAPLKLKVPAADCGLPSSTDILKMEMTFNLLYDEHLFIEHPPKKIQVAW